MIKKSIIFLAVPALIIHEISHVLMILLLGAKGNGIEVKGDVQGFEVVVNYETNCNWKKNIISLAPIGGFIIWSFLIYFTSGLLFLGLAAYTILFVRVFFPSRADIDTYQSNIEEEIDIPEFIQ